MRKCLILAAAMLSMTAPVPRLPGGAIRDVQLRDPGVRPVTRPATRPASERVPASVSPAAAEMLKTVSAAYRALKSLELSGTVTFVIVEGGRTRRHDASFASAFAAPNRFRHDVAGGQQFGCTGRKVYAYSEESHAYIETDAPAERVMLRDLPPDHAQALPSQNLSLVLAISKDADAELREMAAEISVPEGSRSALRLVAADRSAIATVELDERSHLVKRVVVDYKPLFAAMGRDDVSSAMLTVDYTAVKTDGPVGADAFEWSPPAGARELNIAAAGQRDDPSASLVGRPAPDFALKGMDGSMVKLADLRGSVVLLDFWATWCGPCRAALPRLDALNRERAAAGLKVFAVNLREDGAKIEQFLKQTGLSLPVLLDTDGAVAGRYGISAIPATVLIDKEGVVRKVTVGFEPSMEEQLKQAVEALLK